MPGLRWPARERAATFGAAARRRYLPADRTAHRGSATASPATTRPSCRTSGGNKVEAVVHEAVWCGGSIRGPLWL